MIDGRVQVPPSVKPGEPFQVRVLVQHPMETGFRRDMDGKAVPMNVVETIVCRLAGREVFRAELGTGMSANPYVAFHAVAEASGELVVEWRDDRGEQGRSSVAVRVA